MTNTPGKHEHVKYAVTMMDPFIQDIEYNAHCIKKTPRNQPHHAPDRKHIHKRPDSNDDDPTHNEVDHNGKCAMFCF